MLRKHFFNRLVVFTLLLMLGYALPPKTFAKGVEDDARILTWMQQTNQALAARGLGIGVGQIELFTANGGRPVTRLFKNGYRFVPNDQRRNADGNNIRYLVDSTADTPFRGDTTSGLTHVQTEAAIDRAMHTWQVQSCMKNVNIVKRSVANGVDPDLFDFYLFQDGHSAGQVSLYQADIVHGGWLGPPPFGSELLAFAITAYYTQSNGDPTDINNDGYGDTAFVEIYYNDTVTWGINTPLPAVDVESVALHEIGHALGLDHFGPPPLAVMNDNYVGLRQAPFPTDNAALCGIWRSWPLR